MGRSDFLNYFFLFRLANAKLANTPSSLASLAFKNFEFKIFI